MKTVNRKFSGLLACVLTLLLAFSFAVPAFAAPEKGPGNLKVTIRNNDGLPAMTENQFTVYQIFSGTADKDENTKVGENEWDAFSWNNYTLADIKWGSSITDSGTALLKALKDLKKETADWAYPNGDTNVFASVTTAAELAKVLAEHTENHFLQNFAKTVLQSGNLTKVNVTPTVNNESDASKDSLTFDLQEQGSGYYLFDETDNDAAAVSEYMLAVVGEQDILLKASIPDVDKDIIEGITDKKGEAAGVGDYVQFKLTGTLPKNYGDFDNYKYIFHDTLSKGLTYVQNDDTHPLTVRVYENQEAADADVTHQSGFKIEQAADTYKVSTTGSEGSNPCNLEVIFDDLKTLKVAPEITSESVFVVTYYAQVNKDAVLLSTGNPNTVLLEYSNNPNSDGTGKTKEKKVYVYAFGLDLKKVGSDENKPLAGAGFLLKNEAGNYAIFEDQWVVNDTVDGVTTQTFYNSKDTADSAAAGKETAKVEGPVRRLTGWTEAGSTSETVKTAITAYQNAKKDFDKASSEQQAPEGTAYKALQEAKKGLKTYLLESGEDGAIPDVYGLDAGKYNLEEVIVPDGYNTPEKDFDIDIQAKIDENGTLQSVQYKHGEETVTYKAAYDGNVDVPEGDNAGNMVAHFKAGLVQDEIVNQKAPFLPFTGGIGTTIFYVLGLTLIGGAVTYLVIASKKRKKADENA